MGPSTVLKWHPLEVFDGRFRENLSALASRDPMLASRLEALVPAAPFFIAAEGDNIYLGQPAPEGIAVLPDAMPPASARKMLKTIFPNDHVNWTLAVGGLAYGWLWDRVAKLPCKVDSAPGHRPPVYLLTTDVDRLWAVLHVMDWRQMLADPRMAIFAGPDAARQMMDRISQDPRWPQPKAALGIEPGIFPVPPNAMIQDLASSEDQRLQEFKSRLNVFYNEGWSWKGSAGRLKVLGITSRYTTFLQYSMRDWLEAFERLGHETKLVMEPDNHMLLGPFGVAKAMLEFRPDLVIVIDHYRAEMGPLPRALPCVMYVQDRLSNIFSREGGESQGPADYCLGFGKLHLSRRYGYPTERFLPAPVGINEQQFSSIHLTRRDHDRFGCDVSYVSHASRPADQLLSERVQKSGSLEAKRLCDDIYQRMEAWYAGGGPALGDVALRKIVDQSMDSTGIQLVPDSIEELVEFLNHVVSNSMFRHQSLLWLAEMDVKINLWGKGWENHPHLKSFSRGVADNREDLPRIYRASKINLQITPHGAVHQRLLDGLAAGAFFLVRYTPGDAVGIPYLRLWQWCGRNRIGSDEQMRNRADDDARKLISQIDSLLGYDTHSYPISLFDCLEATADGEFMNLASTVWPEQYLRIAFNSREELHAKVQNFLTDEPSRREIARQMKEQIIEKFSYVSINRRLLRMIDEDIERRARQTRVAA